MSTQRIEVRGETRAEAFARLRRFASKNPVARRLENELEEAQARIAWLETRDEESFPAEIVDQLVDGENPVRVFRLYRGLTQAKLAQKAGIGKAMLSEIEAGKKQGSVETVHALALALDVDMEDLVG